jgi:hypothetical protein
MRARVIAPIFCEEASVAYRRLGAVAFAVFGWMTVACGSGPAGLTSPGPDNKTAAPSNPDQPPQNAADTPPNSSQAPAGGEQPGSPGQPGKPPPGGGGNLAKLCQRFCDRLDACADPTGPACEADECTITPAQEAAIAPCKSQITALYNCALNLPDVCGEQAAQCQPYAQAFNDCVDANGIDDLGEEPETNNPPPAPPAGGMCTMANSCQCTTACEFCTCYGGTAAECADLCP